MSVQRFRQRVVGFTHYPIEPHDDGPYVLFSDHERALEDVRAAAVVGVAHARKAERADLPADSVAEGVRLLQSIGLDITYTDEGLEVIAAQMIRMGQREARQQALADADRTIAAMPTSLWINANSDEAQGHKQYVRAAVGALAGAR